MWKESKLIADTTRIGVCPSPILRELNPYDFNLEVGFFSFHVNVVKFHGTNAYKMMSK
jgi:hypothetical protein